MIKKEFRQKKKKIQRMVYFVCFSFQFIKQIIYSKIMLVEHVEFGKLLDNDFSRKIFYDLLLLYLYVTISYN